MPDRPLSEEAKNVGMDKPVHDFTEWYDKEVGKYVEQKPSIAPPKPAPAPPTPYTLDPK
jgi:hypothetical protein